MDRMDNKTEVKTEEQQRMEKALGRVKTADRFRLFFLFVALLLVLFLFYGNKFMAENAWFMNNRQTVYDILFYDVIFMFVSTIVKMILVSTYNKLVKKQRMM